MRADLPISRMRAALRTPERAMTIDASVGDAGSSPYKGVANSDCADMVKLGATWFYNWQCELRQLRRSSIHPDVVGSHRQ